LTTLILKRASASPPSGEWNDDDFEVLCDGVVVGRILKVHAAPLGSPWMWTLALGHHEDRTPTHGTPRRARPRWRPSRRAGGGNERKPRGCRGFRSLQRRRPRGNEPLDTPILSQKIRQGADRVSAPTRRDASDKPGLATTLRESARRDQTDQRRTCRLVRYPLNAQGVKESPGRAEAFRYLPRQLFANGSRARRSWRAKGQSRRGIPARLEPAISTPERNSR